VILLEKLDILEQKILGLVELVATLKNLNGELAAKLKEKEEEVNGLRQEMESLLGEKEQVKQKVAHLIECVEAF
jgi:FtsZ-binding cell division protein ZapB